MSGRSHGRTDAGKAQYDPQPSSKAGVSKVGVSKVGVSKARGRGQRGRGPRMVRDGSAEGKQLNGLGLELGGVLLSWFAGSHEWILVSFGPEF